MKTLYAEEVLEEIKRFIDSRMQEEITLKKISDAVCYSEEYISRFFKSMTGENLFDYIRNRRMIRAGERLREEGGKVIDIALDSGYTSHEGFTRAFTSYFGISPIRFRTLKPEIKHFMPRGMKAFPLEYREDSMESMIIFTRLVRKEERKLLFYPGKKATHYFEYCEELGCDVWGKLMEIENGGEEPLGLWLPEKYRTGGTSEYVQGVEVPVDYSGELPEGLVSVDLPACNYMIFQSEPYEESDENMIEAVRTVQRGIATWNPELYGFEWAREEGPRYQLIPLGERGYIEAVPVRPQ